MAIHIGTSGWSYDHWEGVLYPHALEKRARLGVYTQHFRTVEVNSSFYRWPQEATLTNWRRSLPENFLMSLKAPRALTHSKRLYQPEGWIERISRGVKLLGDRAGVLLVQLPPALVYDYPRLKFFLSVWPREIRTAFEFRHPSWNREETYQLLEAHGAAYCVMSGAGLPCVLRATAPFVYARLHGPDHEHMCAGSYSEAELHWWAERISEWRATGKDVFVYFNNDGEGNAVQNAAALSGILNSRRGRAL
ncbi:MAG TPA: DUF72 domain-containing protein [Pyrinomonadaceae bacterium]|jgi:uncharacterized protein YecE (DUF72 family)